MDQFYAEINAAENLREKSKKAMRDFTCNVGAAYDEIVEKIKRVNAENRELESTLLELKNEQSKKLETERCKIEDIACMVAEYNVN